jgi:hypothetical protein
MADRVESIIMNDELPEEVREFAFWSLKTVGHQDMQIAELRDEHLKLKGFLESFFDFA